MKKFIIALLLLCSVAKAQSPVIGKIGPFEITDIDSKSVTFKVVAKTKIYNVAFISGNQTFDATYISNIVGDIVFSNGATAREGSQLMTPHSGNLQSADMELSSGMVITCTFNKTPDGFLPQRVMFQTGKISTPMYFDVPALAILPENAITYEDKAYTVSLGTIANEGQGVVTVEVLTVEKIEIPMKNGALIAPIMMKIEAGGKTIDASKVSILDNSMTFTFNETPDKVIVYGNDDNANAPTVTFDITKDRAMATATTTTITPVAPVAPQPSSQPETVEQKTTTQQTPPTTQQPTTAAQKTQPEAPFVQPSKPLTTDEKWRRWYVEFGLLVGFLSPEPIGSVNLKTMTPVGAAINIGVYINPRHRLSFDLGVGGNNRKIGSFEYSKTGSTENFTDGVIYRDYLTTSILFTYHYIFTPSEKFNIRLGALGGGLHLSGTDRYVPTVDNTPDLNESDDLRAAFGAGAGFIWKLGKRCFLDCGYRLIAGTEITLDDFFISLPAHQFTLTFGFRF